MLDFRGHPVIVTGAGGWLGRATLHFLDQVLGESVSSRVLAFGSSARPLILPSGRALACAPLSDMANLPPAPYLLMHYAFLTKDRVAGMPAAAFIDENQAIGDFVEGQALRLGAAGLFVPSSGAVYRPGGSIDDDLAANPYGVMKARDERRFAALAGQGRRVAVCRVFNLAGPYINKPGAYALGSILADIARGGPIRLAADRPVIRSYAHVMDVVQLAFAQLLGAKDPDPAPYDTAGEEEIEIGDLARRAARLLGAPDMPIERPPYASGTPNRYVGDGTRFAALLAHYALPRAPLNRQIMDTAAFLSS